MDLIVLKYGDKFESVCYLLGTNNPIKDIEERMKQWNKAKILTIEKVRKILKLSKDTAKKEKDHFGRWEEFFRFYCKYYPR